MPDVISRLSDPEVGVDEESFRTISRSGFSPAVSIFITKYLDSRYIKRTCILNLQYILKYSCFNKINLSNRAYRTCFADICSALYRRTNIAKILWKNCAIASGQQGGVFFHMKGLNQMTDGSFDSTTQDTEILSSADQCQNVPKKSYLFI